MHLPHWMQVCGSHTGISSDRLRFSQRAVPVGKVPSTGMALTGTRSPRPAMMGRAHSERSRERRPAPEDGPGSCCGRAGTGDLEEVGDGVVHRPDVHLHDLLALLAVGLADGVLDGLDRFLAGQNAGHREEAGLHDGVDAAAHAGLAGHLGGVDRVDLRLLVDQRLSATNPADDPKPPPPARARSTGRSRPAPSGSARS
jgi:hypothetical protein